MIDKQSPSSAPKLFDRVRGKIRLKHYSIYTEQAYVDWIKRFILFPSKCMAKWPLIFLFLNLLTIGFSQ